MDTVPSPATRPARFGARLRPPAAPPTRQPRWRRAAVALGLAVLAASALAACGDDDTASGSGSGSASTTAAAVAPTATITTTAPAVDPTSAVTSGSPSTKVGYPMTVDTPSGPLTIDAQPQAIVSLSPTATEVLFAVGAGEQVKAVDDQSSYPPEAPRTSLSGFQPNVEAIAAEQPDLVVVSDDSAGIGAALAPLGIPVLVQPAATTLEDTYAQIAQLGAVTGHPDQAAAVVDEVRAKVDAVVAQVPAGGYGLRYYHELDDTLYSVTSNTFIGQVYALLGLENIADEAGKAAGDYPQLSAEYILEADPELVFLADTKCCGQDASTVAARPGWSTLSAVTGGGVVPLDDDIASRWGPRIADLLAAVQQRVAAVAGKG